MTHPAQNGRRRGAVLIVDDDPLAIEVLADALDGDCDIRFALTGAQALQMLDGAAPPELILLDMVLPDTDGYGLYAAIKSRAAICDVPVIFVTSMRDTASEARGLEMGAADYITKPISPPIVRARVRNHIELARTRAALVASRNEALAAARAKAAFLATMSHEIRTPLNGVIGMTGLLAATQLDPQQRDFVDTIKLSGEALLTLINDVLDYSKIDAGHMELADEALPVLPLIEDTYEILAGRAREKGLELVSCIDPGVPAGMQGDALRLRQILINLVGNAVKFTERGEVFTAVRVLPAADGTEHIEFRVTDTGIGIAPERVGALFEPFTQVDSSTTRRYGGSGLGLAICRRLVGLMGGHIALQSTPGAGSQFYFSVPLRRAAIAQPPLPQASRDALQGRRALVIEGNARSRHYLRTQLEAWGLTVQVADCGEAALAALASARFDLALVDQQLPAAAGATLAQRIRQHPACGALPMIALSRTFDAAAVMPPVYGARLLKPLRQAPLLDAVITVLGAAPSRQAGTAASAFNAKLAQQYPLRVLVVDDNAVNRAVAELTLARLGYQPKLAADGRQAVEQVAQAHAAGERFELVFMDVQMPLMDGLEATRIIKSNHGEQSPVIVAMTAGVSVDDRDNCFSAGMDDFVSKPINIRQLEATLARWGGRRRSGAA